MRTGRIITLAAASLLLVPVAGCTSGVSTTTPLNQATPHEAVVSADYPSFTTAKDMWNDADLVVQANISRVRTARDKPLQILEPGDEGYDDPKANPLYGLSDEEVAKAKKLAEQQVGDIVTIAKADITHVFKGDVGEAASIEVRQLGGELNGEKLTARDEIKLKQNKSYLLFLHTWDDNRDTTMINPGQGQYIATAAGGMTATTANKDDIYAPLPGNKIEISRSTLEALAKNE